MTFEQQQESAPSSYAINCGFQLSNIKSAAKSG
jgi:hypothetical protein